MKLSKDIYSTSDNLFETTKKLPLVSFRNILKTVCIPEEEVINIKKVNHMYAKFP